MRSAAATPDRARVDEANGRMHACGRSHRRCRARIPVRFAIASADLTSNSGLPTEDARRRIDYHLPMTPLLNPPYPGQGEPIPSHIGKGTWIVRDLAILFDDAEPGNPTAEMRTALPP